MKSLMYGDMAAFTQVLRDEGYQSVRVIDTAGEIFGSKACAKLLALGASAALAGRK